MASATGGKRVKYAQPAKHELRMSVLRLKKKNLKRLFLSGLI